MIKVSLPVLMTFPLGSAHITPAALDALTSDEVRDALSRHGWRDWGDVCAKDRAANDAALESGGRILSAYRNRAGVKFWVITEADRSATTVLLPADY